MPDPYSQYIDHVPNVGLQYNVGNIVRAMQERYNKPGVATPETIGRLLEGLRQLTNQINAKAVWVPVTWRNEFAAWMSRLDGYETIVKSAPAGDIQAIANGVSIPLIVGTRIVDGKYQDADIRTPFMLANQVTAMQEFMDDRLSDFFTYIGESVPTIPVPTLPDFTKPGKWPLWAKGFAVAAAFALIAYGVGRIRE